LIKYFLLSAALFLAFISNAQVNKIAVTGNKFDFGIDVGFSLPASDFASSSLPAYSSNNVIDGYAKTGFCYDLHASYKFSKYIGIMVLYGNNINPINTSELTTSMGASSSASGEYTVAEYLVGPYFSLTLVKIKIEAKLLGGIVTSNYPTLTFDNAAGSVIDAFQNGSGFGYLAGAKIKYMMIGGMFGIGIGVNYVSSGVSYSGWTSTLSGAGTSQAQSNGSIKMNIGLVQVMLGLSLDI
jgi:hypothetical protein